MSSPDQRTPAPDGRPSAEQPAWRRDFPIDLAEADYVARRDFTKFLGLTSLAFVVGQFWIVLQNSIRRWHGQPPVQPIARLDEVPVGGARLFSYPGKHDFCVLLRPAADKLLAYNQKCTHLSCAVVPEVEQGQLHCPCHHGVFDMASGRPIAGPPRRPLSAVTLEIRDDVIYATGVELRTV
jgi:nitrite reductase/ring-hydroxylating ferredoxin subunit